MHIYIYIYMYREREREKEMKDRAPHPDKPGAPAAAPTAPWLGSTLMGSLQR